MPKKAYSEIADSLAAGGWFFSEHNNERNDQQLAAIVDIMVSLRTIARILKCDNVQRMAMAAQNIDKTIRSELKRRKKTTKQRKATASRN